MSSPYLMLKLWPPITNRGSFFWINPMRKRIHGLLPFQLLCIHWACSLSACRLFIPSRLFFFSLAKNKYHIGSLLSFFLSLSLPVNFSGKQNSRIGLRIFSFLLPRSSDFERKWEKGVISISHSLQSDKTTDAEQCLVVRRRFYIWRLLRSLNRLHQGFLLDQCKNMNSAYFRRFIFGDISVEDDTYFILTFLSIQQLSYFLLFLQQQLLDFWSN